MITITSKSNNLVRFLISLKKKRSKREEDLFLLEGLSTIAEAFENNYEIPYLIVSKNHACDPEYERIIKMAETKGSNVVIAGDRIVETLADTVNSQGIIAVPKKVMWDKSSILKRKPAFIIALDEVKDPGNLGTILRLAEAVQASGIVLSESSVDMYNNKVVRSSRGAIFTMPVIRPDNFRDFLAELKHEGMLLVTTSPVAPVCHWDIDFKKPVVMILGNESRGVSEEVEKLADTKIKIPIMGCIESLNVAVAASIISYESLRQKLQK